MIFKIKFTYFRNGGKFYTEEEIKYTDNESVVGVGYRGIERADRFLSEKSWPGLVEGAKEFHVLVDILDMEGNSLAQYLRINQRLVVTTLLKIVDNPRQDIFT